MKQPPTTLEEAYTQVQEGFFDRVKANVTGAAKAVSDVASLGDVTQLKSRFQDNRSRDIITIHVQKIFTALDDFFNDLNKSAKISKESNANLEQISFFLKNIIGKIATEHKGKGYVTIADLKNTLGKAGFLDPAYHRKSGKNRWDA